MRAIDKRYGIIWTITGDGKGKTTAAFGQALRALGQGQKVAILQFLKGSQVYGEKKFLQSLRTENLLVKQFGLPTFVHNRNAAFIDRDLAVRGWEYGESLFKDGFDLIIFDEINIVLSFGMLDKNKVIKALTKKPQDLSIILTGRDAPEEILAISDTISWINNIRHHFDAGILAQSGIEY